MSVDVDANGAVRVITLNRPEKRNAMSPEMTLGLDTALNAFEDDPQARVAILTGGPRFFSAGTDIATFAGEPTERGGPYGIAARRLAKPVIAAVEGAALGGGFEIALAATLIVASAEATFAFPEVTLGLIAECGGLFRGPRALPLNLARELLLTGERLTARRAYDLGLVNRLADPGQALPVALDLAERIAGLAPIAVRETLRAIDAIAAADDDRGWDRTGHARETARASHDAKEGIAAFLARRSPTWTDT